MSRITELSEPGRTSRVKQLMDDPSVEPREGVRRYVMVSSGMADDPAKGGDALRSYLEAKAEADAYVTAETIGVTFEVFTGSTPIDQALSF